MITLRIICDCGAIIRSQPGGLIRGQFVQCGFCKSWLRARLVPVEGDGRKTMQSGTPVAPLRCPTCGTYEEPCPCERKRSVVPMNDSRLTYRRRA